MRIPRTLSTTLLILTLATSRIALALPVQGQRMLVAGPSPYSIEIVKDIVRKGGNVADATVAVALGLAVTTPYYAALGGGGFAMVRIGTHPPEALDFREVAPKAAGADFYKDRPKTASVDGGAAVGVPGVPAGLWELHRKYGKLPWKRLFEIPLRLAEQGFQVSGEWVTQTKRNQDRFNSGGLAAFFKSKGASYLPGDTLKQPKLALLLRELATNGPKAFYEGKAAKDLVATVEKAGGVLSLDDLKNYRTRWLTPLTAEYSGYKLYLMPPPSSGGIVLTSALRMIDSIHVNDTRPLSVNELHHLGEILKIAFRGRNLLGDPTFVTNPIDMLISPDRLKTAALTITPDKTLHLEPQKEPTEKESTETTHFSLLDANGDSVAFTVTLNGTYGSAVVSDRFGVSLNNEMDDFTTRPGEANMFGLIQGRANAIAAGKRPLSSMSPTLVEKDGRIVLSLGASGGPRIISGVLQVLYRTLTTKWDIDQAIQTPRIHHQFLPDTLYVDSRRLSPDVLDRLGKIGHNVQEEPIARVNGVFLNNAGVIEAAADSRGEGAAGGL